MDKIELRTYMLNIEDRKDGFSELTLIIDRVRDKPFFYKIIDSYRDNKIIVLKWVEEK